MKRRLTSRRKPLSPNSADLMAALKLQVDLSNSEKQAIWARHATMVVSNSLIISAVLDKPDGYINRVLDFTGFFLCVLWAIMTWVGWTWFYKALRDGAALEMHPSLNPFATFQGIGDRHSDTVFKCAMFTIALFGLFYVFDLLRPFYTATTP